MKINPINHTNQTQPAFQKVNQKYLKWAERDYKVVKNIDTAWYESLRDDVLLFKDVSKKDAIDTINAARKYVNKGSMEAYNILMKEIKNA